MDYPTGFPNHLKPAVAAAILREQLEFPKQNQLRARIKAKTFAVAEISCTAAERGEWRSDLALSGIEHFFHIICRNDPDMAGPMAWSSHEYTRQLNEMHLEITTSKEWLGYLERLAGLAYKTEETTRQPPTDSIEEGKVVILRILDEKGMTRSKWASKAGVDPSVVYDYLEGKSRPRPESRKFLAEAIGLELSDLPDLQNQTIPKKTE